MARILLIEDDAKIVKIVTGDLEYEGYEVLSARDGETGLEKARKLKPDLVLLDIMLPKLSGYDVCRTLRKEGFDVPILMLSGKGQEPEKVFGLELGADDYLAKPYGSFELLARVKALLRRQNRAQEKMGTFEFDDVRIDFKNMQATKKGKPVPLTTKEFQVLLLLIQRRGQTVSRDQFLEEVWCYDESLSTRTIDNQVGTLRQKLHPKDPEAYIHTVHGVGYKFVV